MALKTDYKDDILDTSKNTTRKWTLKNANGAVLYDGCELDDVTEYSQEGDTFNAADINATNTEINTLKDTTVIHTKSTAVGSATQPVYVSASGVATATTYTLGKSVPSNAVFTDTWRGIQNNLTSTSTSDSLSAAQGKALNDKITSLNTIKKYTLSSSSWASNTDSGTGDVYPYKYVVSQSSYFTDTSCPVWDCIGATNSNGIPATKTEYKDIALVQCAYFSSSGVVLYATAKPSGTLILRVKGK